MENWIKSQHEGVKLSSFLRTKCFIKTVWTFESVECVFLAFPIDLCG